MASSASRMVLRQPRFSLRRVTVRNASTASDAANAAKDKTSDATAKATEGLSKVASSAGSAITKVGSAAGSAIGKIGGRTGRIIGRVQALVPPTIYYSKVGLELGKIIFKQRQMSPPSSATFQTYFQNALKNLRNPSDLLSQTAAATNSVSPQNILSRVRNINTQQVVGAGIVAAEVVGFFTVGEMLGRLKIVGYRGGSHAEHH